MWDVYMVVSGCLESDLVHLRILSKQLNVIH